MINLLSRWRRGTRPVVTARHTCDPAEQARTLDGGPALEIETNAMGVVVAVWYQGERLPYVQVIVSDRWAEMIRDQPAVLPALAGVRLIDP